MISTQPKTQPRSRSALSGRLAHLEKGLFVVLLVALIAAIALLDFLTGRDISFSIFYVFPIFTASWYVGKNAGLVLALLSSVLWLIADVAGTEPASHVLIPGWNAVVRLVFFVLVGVSVPYLKLQLHASNEAIQKLSALLPLCAWCKNIRDANGRWSRLETYLEEEKGIEVTHGICPDCIEKYYSRRKTAPVSRAITNVASGVP
jgi:hypothetical protein